jgi:hypothetical protein
MIAFIMIDPNNNITIFSHPLTFFKRREKLGVFYVRKEKNTVGGKLALHLFLQTHQKRPFRTNVS